MESSNEHTPTVTIMVRETCGSCARVRRQIEPVCAGQGAVLQVVDVDTDRALAVEFGDRVPVILVDDEEVACWEIDDEELLEALAAARAEAGSTGPSAQSR
ncbi:glutaredoxin family protein [Corynebacterium sp. AOP40-9SA-29]|uniref:glutaredoxin family protein n=1 Tax=Corynebacterium sp. AOP40-9SA-29 TaxID=3457677 RepID=UPI004034B48E